MSFTLNESWLSVRQLCKEFPGRTGRGISRSTAMRWLLDGVDGVRLESVKIGGARYVSRAALDQFVAALNAGTTAVKPSAKRDAREAERVERLLATEGF